MIEKSSDMRSGRGSPDHASKGEGAESGSSSSSSAAASAAAPVAPPPADEELDIDLNLVAAKLAMLLSRTGSGPVCPVSSFLLLSP